eukprot:TRINITY_DN5004_c0_g1_i4.p1 TRINITY_DN5004_c0_g1~~TRINITY_DN5004_c0_g1_i4.p1  ORF type:complete len:539 (-),score=64.32 TRINITY_DN5004_c0_g1_i4:9-1625(-)
MEKRTCWTSEVCEMMCSDQDDEEQEEGQKQKKSNNDDVQINSRKQNKARKPNVARKGQRNNFVKQQSKRKKTFGQRKFPRRGGRKNYLQTQAGQTGQFDESSYKIGSCFRCGNPGHWANECTEDPNTQGQQKRPKNSEIIDILEPKLDLKPLTQDFSEHGINAIFQQVFGHEKVSTEQYSVLNKLLKMESVLMCMSRNSGKRTVVLLACLLLDGIGIVVTNSVWKNVTVPKQFKSACIYEGQESQQLEKALKRIREGRVNLVFIQPSKMLSYQVQESLKELKCFVCIEDIHLMLSTVHNWSSQYRRVVSFIEDTLKPEVVLYCCCQRNCDQLSGATGILKHISVIDGLESRKIDCGMKVVQLCDADTDCQRLTDISRQLHHVLKAGCCKNSKSVLLLCLNQEITEQVASCLQCVNISCLQMHQYTRQTMNAAAVERYTKGEIRALCVHQDFFSFISTDATTDAIIYVGLPPSRQDFYEQVSLLRENSTCLLFYCKDWFLQQRCNLYQHTYDHFQLHFFLSHFLLASKKSNSDLLSSGE